MTEKSRRLHTVHISGEGITLSPDSNGFPTIVCGIILVGRTLRDVFRLGHKKGETVEIEVPAGTLKYKILKISR